MLDPKFIRENLEFVKEGARKKGVKTDIDAWVVLDDKRRELTQAFDSKKAEQNKASAEIAQADTDSRQAMIVAVGKLKEEVKQIEEELKTLLVDWKEILMNIPNPPSPDMPIGKDDTENMTIKTWGEIPTFDFPVKDHMELGTALDLIDVEKAAEISGSRFYYLKNEAVLLQFAIVQFVFETLGNEAILKNLIAENNLSVSSKPFVPMIPPVMIRNTVQTEIHRVFGDQTYKFEEDGLNLVASAEHTMAPYHMGETLTLADLPKRYIGYSTAFRREAGTYGKDMGGILRTHQFDKLEMESFTDAETGNEEQKFIVAIQQYLVQQLGIPYQLQQVCTGDTGKPDYNQFDIECYMPSQGKYRETHTSDYMTDFQTRGINARYKDAEGKMQYLHTNDATAFAIGRTLIAIFENFQTSDGHITIPEVLRKYMGGRERI
ncbi:MAG: serine--tRNA ligase [Candidatus Peribacteria bacterium]|nr:MAG: serine--tRNA ligase [Candidatus Peribacteria bacterium]